MLSLAKLGAGGESYYLDSVARGAEEYYTLSGEAPGRWLGAAAGELGLAGAVGEGDLRAVLSGLDPSDGERLAPANRRVPGFDLTFSAPKSLSVLFALGDRDAAAAVVAAHEAAVDAVVGWLEREACGVRRGCNGLAQHRGGGLIGAAFRHRTSRAGDPQLHTHVLVANLTRGPEGRWSALDARLLYRQRQTAGYLYQAQLRHEITTRLGLTWRPAKKGLAELDAIPAVVLRAFSRRRVEIEAALAERGLGSRRAAEVAALDTRRAKHHNRGVRDDWVDRAAEHGFLASDVDELLAGGRTAQRTGALAERTRVEEQRTSQPPARTRAARHLTERASTFTRSDALRAYADAAEHGAPIQVVEARADALLAGPDVAALADDRYSTHELMEIERHALARSLARASSRSARGTEEAVLAAVAARPTLSTEQRAMVQRLVLAGHGVDVIVGAAGTGKTFALDAARAAWQADGQRVIGCALAARAAAELQAGSGIPSTTLHRLLVQLERRDVVLPRRCVVVLDEAGMVGTRHLARLLQHAEAAQAKVVVVGDHRQLPEIEAGGLFAALAQHLDAIQLLDNRRQNHEWERAALAELRHGDIAQALGSYGREGRIVTATTADALRQRLVADWFAARADGKEAIMLATRRADVEDLNRRARLLLHGQVGDAPIVGDQVMALRNDRRIGLTNGTCGVVTDIGADGTLTIDTKDGPRVIPTSYSDSGALTFGYASTVHKAQGATVDAAFLLGDEALFREAGYVGLSRGRITNTLYIHEALAGPGSSPGDARSLLETLEHSRHHQLATYYAVPRAPDRDRSPGIDIGR